MKTNNKTLILEKKYLRLLLVFLITVIGIETLILTRQYNNKKTAPLTVASQPTKVLGKYADAVIAKCASSSYHPACYDKEIPKLMDEISMEDTFKVTKFVQDKDTGYQYCHVLAHNLSAREVQKYPLRWKELVSRCPSGMCSNGCLHGGFQEKFRSESLSDEQITAIKPDLTTLCEERDGWHPTGLEQASCYHALGHLIMYITNADIRKSIDLCEEMALKDNGIRDYRQLCFDGVFMQIFQPLEPEDFALVKGKQPVKTEVDAFCGAYDGKKKSSCISESWPLYREELQKPQGLVAFCSKEAKGEQERCYSVIMYVLTPQFEFNAERIINYCKGLPSARRGLCIANAASRMIETDYRNISKAVDLCTNSPSEVERNACFNELVLYASYNFHQDSAEQVQLCNALPTAWKEKCSLKD